VVLSLNLKEKAKTFLQKYHLTTQILIKSNTTL